MTYLRSVDYFDHVTLQQRDSHLEAIWKRNRELNQSWSCDYESDQVRPTQKATVGVVRQSQRQWMA